MQDAVNRHETPGAKTLDTASTIADVVRGEENR